MASVARLLSASVAEGSRRGRPGGRQAGLQRAAACLASHRGESRSGHGTPAGPMVPTRWSQSAPLRPFLLLSRTPVRYGRCVDRRGARAADLLSVQALRGGPCRRPACTLNVQSSSFPGARTSTTAAGCWVAHLTFKKGPSSSPRRLAHLSTRMCRQQAADKAGSAHWACTQLGGESGTAKVTRPRGEGEADARGQGSTIELEASSADGRNVEQIGGQIRAMRHRRRWSQEALADEWALDEWLSLASSRGTVRSRSRAARTSRDRPACRCPSASGEILARTLPTRDTRDGGVVRVGRASGFDRQFEPGLTGRTVALDRCGAWVGGATDRDRCRVLEHVTYGAAARTSTRKAAEPRAGRRPAMGEAGRAALVWSCGDSARNRALVARYPEAFGARFPGSSSAGRSTCRGRARSPWEAGWCGCDVRRGRLYAWRRAAQRAP